MLVFLTLQGKKGSGADWNGMPVCLAMVAAAFAPSVLFMVIILTVTIIAM
jgi:hypothetical protein